MRSAVISVPRPRFTLSFRTRVFSTIKKTVTTMKPVTPENDCVPKFFRVYMPGISGDDLELPVCFNSFLPKPLPKHVTLKSIYGKIWKMALRRCGGGDPERYMLLNGWKRIAKDESLTTGNVLEFQLDDDGSLCFNFSIYEPLTMCKRLGTTTSVQETEDADDVLVLSDDDFQDSDYSCADDNDASAEDDDHGVAAGNDDAALDGSDDDDDADDVDDNNDDERRYLDDHNNAFFRVKINPKKISQLRIPSKVINDYGLSFSETESINIIDPLVKKFGKLTKKIKVQTNGSVFIKGYGAVYRRNGVRSTDKMICELKKAGNNNVVHTIKFHVIK